MTVLTFMKLVLKYRIPQTNFFQVLINELNTAELSELIACDIHACHKASLQTEKVKRHRSFAPSLYMLAEQAESLISSATEQTYQHEAGECYPQAKRCRFI